MNDDRIQVDRMRYTKNTASSRLALLAIFFNVLYFISLYKLDLYEPRIIADTTGMYNKYYTILLGGSIILNLVFMLLAFLSSEGVKNYKKSFSWIMFALAALQIARIFILPSQLHEAFLFTNKELQTEEGVRIAFLNIMGSRRVTFMTDGQFIRVCLYLIASAICLVTSAIINMRKSSALAAHIENLESLQA